jgi:hypothetical protein
MKWDFGLRLIMYGRVGALSGVFVGANWDVAAVRLRARSLFRVEAHAHVLRGGKPGSATKLMRLRSNECSAIKLGFRRFVLRFCFEGYGTKKVL